MPCILTRCRAFLLPGCNTAPRKRLQRVLCSQCNYTAHAAKQRARLYMGFSCDCTRSTAHDTRPIQADIIPPVPRWRAYTRPDALHRYPRYHRHAGTLCRIAQAAYYNNVYKGADHARRCSISQTMPAAAGQPGGWRSGTGSVIRAGRSGTLHPAGQSSDRGAAGGAEPLAAPAASLFGLSPDS